VRTRQFEERKEKKKVNGLVIQRSELLSKKKRQMHCRKKKKWVRFEGRREISDGFRPAGKKTGKCFRGGKKEFPQSESMVKGLRNKMLT